MLLCFYDIFDFVCHRAPIFNRPSWTLLELQGLSASLLSAMLEVNAALSKLPLAYFKS